MAAGLRKAEMLQYTVCFVDGQFITKYGRPRVVLASTLLCNLGQRAVSRHIYDQRVTGPTGDMRMRDMTRMRLLQVWFAAVMLTVIGVMAFGMNVTAGTGAMLLALSLVPAAMVLLLWPGIQPRTAADVLYDRNRPV